MVHVHEVNDIFCSWLICFQSLSYIRDIIKHKCTVEQPGKHLRACCNRPSSETPFEWRFAGGPLVARHCVLGGSENPVTGIKEYSIFLWFMILLFRQHRRFRYYRICSYVSNIHCTPMLMFPAKLHCSDLNCNLRLHLHVHP